VKVAVVLLNYNGKKWLEKFLPNVMIYSENADIVVIDNASTDDSLEFLRTVYPKVRVIINDQNFGFAGGYNAGLSQIESDIYVLLNSDVEVTEGWINAIIDFFEKNPQCAGAQPKILSYHHRSHFEYAGASGGFLDKFGYPFCRGRIFNTVEQDQGQYNTNQKVFWASGACLFIRSNLFHQAGGFDTDYFAHMEEIDLCWRIQKMGYSFYCVPSSVVYHVGGGTLNYISPHKTYLNFRNSLFTLHKNGQRNLPFLIFVRLLLDGVAGLKFLLSGSFRHTVSIIQAHFSYYASLSKLNKKRRELRGYTSPVSGQFKISIVWQYYIAKKKVYSNLIQ
jgi:GT2 family glycosyltransferase